MPTSFRIPALLLCLSLALLVGADLEPPAVPSTAKSTDDVYAAVNVDAVKGFGCVQTAEFNHWGKRIFAIWYCPFSGIGDCFLHVYYLDHPNTQWVRFVNKLVPSGGDLSVELPTSDDVLLVRDTAGKIVLKESLAKVPYKDWNPTTQK